METIITNQTLYHNKVNGVELNLTINSGSFQGDVTIETEKEEKTYSGEHGSHDFEKEFGFIIE